jgi:L-amino acid N-acyltransferase YncA
VLIRPIEDRDWRAVYAIFSEIVAAGRTYAYPEGLSSAESRPLWVEQPPGITVVAIDDDGAVSGTAKAGPNRPGRGSHIATASFMVDSRRQGEGIGRALGSWAIEWARRAGYRGMQFNAVVETNVPAVQLWQQLGFRIIGTVPEAFDHTDDGLVGLHVMYLRL